MSDHEDQTGSTIKDKIVAVAKAAAPIAGQVALTIGMTVAASVAAKAITDRMDSSK